MRILITESRLQQLINNVLNDEFGELYEYSEHTIERNGEFRSITYSKEGQNVMRYYFGSDYLYIANEMLNKLNIFGLDDNNDNKKELVIGKWFESVYELPVDAVGMIDIEALN